MTLKPPDWADLGEPKYDVWVRIEIMKARYATADILDARYGMTSTQEEIMDRILVWYMETGKPQNLTGLSQITGRSEWLVKKDVKELVAMDMIILIRTKLWPSLWFTQGSVTSASAVDTAIDSVRSAERLLQERKDNTQSHQDRQQKFEHRLSELREITETINLSNS